jgi:hypothetical protein
MAEMAGRKELALGHNRTFRTKNGGKWLLNREETKRETALLKRKTSQVNFIGANRQNLLVPRKVTLTRMPRSRPSEKLPSWLLCGYDKKIFL